MTHVLDNIVWHTLTGRHASLGERLGSAARFHPDVSLFSAVADPAANQGWEDLARLLGQEVALLFAPGITVPDGWTVDMRLPCLQMVADGVPADRPGVPMTDLGDADVDDMLALVEATRPGPMTSRTPELGRFVGLREDGRLVAMAGERFRAPAFSEISLVCTAPEARGRGLARAAVLSVLEGIRGRGEEGFLHVVADNAPAIALYGSMGFSVRTEVDAILVRNGSPG